MTQLVWLRRDLRQADHPALAAAVTQSDGAPIAVVYVVDPTLWAVVGAGRRAWLAACLLSLRDDLGGRLCLAVGDPRVVVPQLARGVGARSVHVTREPTPYGQRRDRAVARALADQGVSWQESGSPYAVTPGRVLNTSGRPYQVFTPFSKAWREHWWPAPAARPPALPLLELPVTAAARQDDGHDALSLLTEAVQDSPIALPEPGERAGLRRWQKFLSDGLAAYDHGRDRADQPGSSRLSPYLRLGVLHPRTLLADLVDRTGVERPDAGRFITELAWREFYADVLWHHPASAWRDLRASLAHLTYDHPEDAIDAWRHGRTGYPFVDAGMRQLLATGWMHNRARMVTASFLVKDLHVHWTVGARHFLDHLLDGDIASNNHGWQWAAGTGTDAAPYIRVFNPVTQGRRADPDGDYVRRWVPELRHLPGASVHEPWVAAGGYDHGYPARIVDHAEERRETLRRFAARPGNSLP